MSSRGHLPRIFCYVWELQGWSFARSVTYVAAPDSASIRTWVEEVGKIIVIALPYRIQQRLELWYAKRTHTYHPESL